MLAVALLTTTCNTRCIQTYTAMHTGLCLFLFVLLCFFDGRHITCSSAQVQIIQHRHFLQITSTQVDFIGGVRSGYWNATNKSEPVLSSCCGTQSHAAFPVCRLALLNVCLLLLASAWLAVAHQSECPARTFCWCLPSSWLPGSLQM